jgi:SAM-dependent methyltransferase
MQPIHTCHNEHGRWQGVIPLPPQEMMNNIGSSSLELFYFLAEACYQTVSQYLIPDSTVLDMGCGCGAKARFFANHPWVHRYIGFDCDPVAIAWCQEYIVPAASDVFEFHHFDLHSQAYNPKGALKASEFVFPAKDRSVDMAFAGSLFTHLLEPDARHYLDETYRVLALGGTAILSIHGTPPTGSEYSGDEGRIEVRPDYFLSMARDSHLYPVYPDRESFELCGQRVFILRRG